MDFLKYHEFVPPKVSASPQCDKDVLVSYHHVCCRPSTMGALGRGALRALSVAQVRRARAAAAPAARLRARAARPHRGQLAASE